MLKKIDKIISKNELSFSLIYGRRRVGKSELVKQVLKKIMLEVFIMNVNRLRRQVMSQA